MLAAPRNRLREEPLGVKNLLNLRHSFLSMRESQHVKVSRLCASRESFAALGRPNRPRDQASHLGALLVWFLEATFGVGRQGSIHGMENSFVAIIPWVWAKRTVAKGAHVLLARHAGLLFQVDGP